MKFPALIVGFIERDRHRSVLLVCAAAIGVAYVLVTFDVAFLKGGGPFWANPVGPWLMDSADNVESVDLLGLQVSYLGFLKAHWQLPVFFLPNLGAPSGTSIIYADATPFVALMGKLSSELTGHVINPYGVWTAACFVLSAVFAALFVIELGQRSILAVAAASVLAVSAPSLLHRFGHVGLMAHFVVIGALLFYLRDCRVPASRILTARWAVWMCLATLLHAYLFVMVVAVYVASVLHREARNPGRGRTFLRERLTIIVIVAAFIWLAGHFGKGTGSGYPSASGFGYYSMNLASPFWPQRSGLFPGLQDIVDATGGQYEGFNYFGFGALLLTVAAAVLNFQGLLRLIVEHKRLCVVLGCLTVFAVSQRVFLGDVEVLDLDYSQRLDVVLGVFRSSGRMFWPVLYAVMLSSLVLVLRNLTPGPRAAFVVGCCALQMIDTGPLRDRLSMLTRREVPRLLDQGEWQARMRRAAAVRIAPPVLCAGPGELAAANFELQFAALAVDRPVNSVYNPRLRIDCAADAASVRTGPWRTDTLYVFLTGGTAGGPPGWTPAGLACTPFKLGTWCLGLKPAP